MPDSIYTAEDQKILDAIERAKKRRRLEEESYKLSPEGAGADQLLDIPLAVGEAGASIASQVGTMIERPPDMATGIASIGPALAAGIGLVKPETARRAQERIRSITRFMPTGGIEATDLPGVEQLRRRIGGGIRRFGERRAAPYTEAREQLPVSWPVRTTADLAGTFVQSAPSVAGAFIGGPGLAALFAGGQSYAQLLDQGIQNLQKQNPDLSREEAAQQAESPAIFAGLITAGLTRFFPGGTERLAAQLGKAFKEGRLTQEILKRPIRDYLKEVGLEMPEEMLDETSQALIEMATTRPDMPWAEVVNRVAMAGLGAFVTAGTLSGVHAGLKRVLSEKQREEAAKPAEPTAPAPTRKESVPSKAAPKKRQQIEDAYYAARKDYVDIWNDLDLQTNLLLKETGLLRESDEAATAEQSDAVIARALANASNETREAFMTLQTRRDEAKLRYDQAAAELDALNEPEAAQPAQPAPTPPAPSAPPPTASTVAPVPAAPTAPAPAAPAAQAPTAPAVQIPSYLQAQVSKTMASLGSDQQKKIQDLAAEGKSTAAIAKTLKLPVTEVRNAKLGLGIPNNVVKVGAEYKPNPDFEAWAAKYRDSLRKKPEPKTGEQAPPSPVPAAIPPPSAQPPAPAPAATAPAQAAPAPAAPTPSPEAAQDEAARKAVERQRALGPRMIGAYYDALLEAAKAGQSTVYGYSDPVAAKLLPLVKGNRIRTRQELEDWINAGMPKEPSGVKPMLPEVGDEVSVVREGGAVDTGYVTRIGASPTVGRQVPYVRMRGARTEVALPEWHQTGTIVTRARATGAREPGAVVAPVVVAGQPSAPTPPATGANPAPPPIPKKSETKPAPVPKAAPTPAPAKRVEKPKGPYTPGSALSKQKLGPVKDALAQLRAVVEGGVDAIAVIDDPNVWTDPDIIAYLKRQEGKLTRTTKNVAKLDPLGRPIKTKTGGTVWANLTFVGSKPIGSQSEFEWNQKVERIVALRKAAADEANDQRSNAMRVLGQVLGHTPAEIDWSIQEVLGKKGVEKHATEERQVETGREPEHRGVGPGVQEEREDRQRTPEEQVARPEDRGSGGVQPSSPLLTPAQLNRYTGGTIVYSRTGGTGALEVTAVRDQYYTVRNLETGKTYNIPKGSVIIPAKPTVPLKPEQMSRYTGQTIGYRKDGTQPIEILSIEGPNYTIRELDTGRVYKIAAVDITLRTKPTRRGFIPHTYGPTEVVSSNIAVSDREVTVGDINYSEPVNPRQAVLMRMVASAVAAMRQRYSGLQIKHIRYASGRRVGASIWTMPSEGAWDTVFVDLDMLSQQTAGFGSDQISNYMASAMSEELIHNASGLAIWQKWANEGGEEGTGMTFREYYYRDRVSQYNDMSQDQRDMVMAQFGLHPSQEVEIAQEFERMLIQQELDGHTTEATRSLGARIMAHLRSVLRWLNSWVTKAPGNSAEGNLIRANADAIMSILTRPQTTTSVEAEPGAPGPAATARAISLREAAAQELTDVPQVTPQQLADVATNIWSQTETAVGHARESWETVPENIKSHMPFMQARFDVLDEYRDKTGAPPTRQQTLEQMVSGMDPVTREIAINDAFLNWHSLKESQLYLQKKLARARREAETLQEKPKKRDVGALKKRLVAARMSELLELKGKYAAEGNDGAVVNINGIIRRVQSMKSGDTIFDRVVGKLFENPNIDDIDPDTVGTTPEHFGIMKSMVRALGGTAAVTEVVDKTSTGKKYAAKVEEQGEIEEALAYLDSAVFGDTEFAQADVEFMTRARGLEVQLKTESDTEMRYQDPDNPEEWHVFQFSTERGMDADNVARMTTLLGKYHNYLMQPRTDPMRAAAISRHIYQMEHYLLNPHFHNGAVHLMTNEMNVWNSILVKATGQRLTTPEQRLVGIASWAKNVAEARYRNWSQTVNLCARIHREWSPDIERAAKTAIDKHGIDAVEWVDEVANPLLWSYQHIGGRRYKAGDKLMGRTITAEDIAAVKVQKAFVDTIITAIRDQQTVQNKAFPRKIQDTKSIYPIDRYAGHTGPMTMPRRLAPKVEGYARFFDGVRNEPENKKLEAGRALVGGTNSIGFQELIVGHMRSIAYNPDYRQFMNSRFKDAYLDMTQRIDDGADDAPTSFDDVIDELLNYQAATAEPEQMMSRSELEGFVLFKEIGRGFDMAAIEASKQLAESAPGAVVSIVRSDNWLTNQRGMQVLPDTMYSFSAATVGDQWQLLHSVHEIYAQNTYDALKRVQTEVHDAMERFRHEIKRLHKLEGVPTEKAIKKVRKESYEQQRLGELLWNYDEAQFHANAIQRSLNNIQAIEKNRADFFNEELRTGWRAGRRVAASGVLASPLIVARNAAGGTLRSIHTMDAMGMAMHQWTTAVPGFWVLDQTAQAMWGVGTSMLRTLTRSQFLAWKLNSMPAVQRALSNESFFGKWFGGLVKVMQREAYFYEKQREFGMAGNADWWKRLKAYELFYHSGGRLRPEEKGKVRELESLAGIAYETGALSLNPANVMVIAADEAANMMGMKAADRVVRQMKVNALSFLSNREEMGIPLEGQLTPQELIGNKRADLKKATFTRNIFSRAGIDIDRTFQRYYQRVKDARRNGADPDSVPFLEGEEYNSLQMVMAEEVNRGSLYNRPEAINQTEWGRWLGLFMGYPIWQNSKFIEARARLSNTKRAKGDWAGMMQVARFLTATAIVGIPVGEIVRMLSALAFDEEREQRDPTQVKDLAGGFKYLTDMVGPFLPMMIGLYNSVAERTIKPGVGIGRSGVNPFPFSLYDSASSWIRDAYATMSVRRPTTKLISQYFPNQKAIMNRLPFYAGSVNYYNVNRSLRAAAPKDLETRKPFLGNIYYRTTTSDNKDNVLNALCMDTGPDWDTIKRERRLGIEQYMKDNNENPERAFDSAVLQRAPMTSVFGRKLTDSERAKILENMSESDKARLMQVEGAFAAYAQAVGREFTLTVREAKPSFAVPPVSAAQGPTRMRLGSRRGVAPRSSTPRLGGAPVTASP